DPQSALRVRERYFFGNSASAKAGVRCTALSLRMLRLSLRAICASSRAMEKAGALVTVEAFNVATQGGHTHEN
ncbi:MAG TPA: hypothetical protein VFE89_04610, partial [Beijerinckiaceae bacterium]|nr:hypothetical protein [Beijerinckiaceae bacterium]